MGIQPSESLPPGSNAPWPTWKTLNRLRSGIGRTRANLIKWDTILVTPRVIVAQRHKQWNTYCMANCSKHLALMMI